MKKSVWAVTANGSRAKIVKNLGDDQEEMIDMGREHERTCDIKTDRAGRGFASVGKSRFGLVLHSDPVRNRERLFAETISEFLAASVRANELDKLVVVASPRTLGDLRSAFPPQLLEKVLCEIDKDYTTLPAKELSERMRAIAKKPRQFG